MKPSEIAILAVFFGALVALLVVAGPLDGVGIMVEIEHVIGGRP
jgi:hypothetical protein